jgi:hypothetical protein
MWQADHIIGNAAPPRRVRKCVCFCSPDRKVGKAKDALPPIRGTAERDQSKPEPSTNRLPIQAILKSRGYATTEFLPPSSHASGVAALPENSVGAIEARRRACLYTVILAWHKYVSNSPGPIVSQALIKTDLWCSSICVYQCCNIWISSMRAELNHRIAQMSSNDPFVAILYQSMDRRNA